MKTIEEIIEEFQQEFCTLYDTPVVVSGILENEGYLALLEDNGSKVSDWLRSELEEYGKAEFEAGKNSVGVTNDKGYQLKHCPMCNDDFVDNILDAAKHAEGAFED